MPFLLIWRRVVLRYFLGNCNGVNTPSTRLAANAKIDHCSLQLLSPPVRPPFTLYASAVATPLTDQFLSMVWPPEEVPWTTSSAPSRSVFPILPRNELPLNKLHCQVPGCKHILSTTRLLALHLRVGHSMFDIRKMKEAGGGLKISSNLSNFGDPSAGVHSQAWRGKRSNAPAMLHGVFVPGQARDKLR